MRLNDINGHYNPSFFNMVLETDENISLAVQKYPSTFVHEFIHYFQDLILPYNIRMNLSNLRWFINIKESAMQYGYITFPFNKWDNDSQTTILQFNQSIGGNYTATAFVDEVESIENIESSFEIASGFDAALSMKHREFKVYRYDMSINGNTATYNLGARDILEYIAYKIETKHCPSESILPQLPYHSIDILFNHYGLSNVSEDIRLCVAECCLFNDNPMRFLFHQFLENEAFKQCLITYDYDEIYKMLLSLEFRATDNVTETLTNKTNRRLEQFANDLTTHYSYFVEIKNWILKVNEFAKTELSNKFIFSDMFRMDNDSFFAFIHNTIGKVGLPLVMNNKEECISLQSEKIDASQFVQFYILQNFIALVTSNSKNKECPIYDFCKANCNIADYSCSLNPQLKRINSYSCPYIDFLKLYKLSNVEFK